MSNLVDIIKQSIFNSIRWFQEQKNEEINNKLVEEYISKTIEILYDLDIDDKKILFVLYKYWNLNYDDSKKRLAYEKIQFLRHELTQYLKEQGYTEPMIKNFWLKNDVYLKLKRNSDLQKLKHNPEKLFKVIQD